MSVLWTTDLAPYEDGRRVKVTDKTFEWWYFDTIMEDGSTCVVTFFSKPPFAVSPLQPFLELNISTPKGKYYQAEAVNPGRFSAATDRCKVIMGPNRVVDKKGDLRTYKLVAEAKSDSGELLKADLLFEDWVPGWRTGPYLPPDEAAKLWLGEQIVIPSGTVRGTLTYGGKPHEVKGTCYHDHQWGGGAPQMQEGLSVTSWYWGRARAGDHSIVFAQILGRVGSGPIVPVGALFMFACGTRMTYDDTLTAVSVTPLGKDPSKKGIEVEWETNQGTVQLRLPSPKQIASLNQGGYVRFLSPAVLESDFGGKKVSDKGRAIWEINTF